MYEDICRQSWFLSPIHYCLSIGIHWQRNIKIINYDFGNDKFLEHIFKDFTIILITNQFDRIIILQCSKLCHFIAILNFPSKPDLIIKFQKQYTDGQFHFVFCLVLFDTQNTVNVHINSVLSLYGCTRTMSMFNRSICHVIVKNQIYIWIVHRHTNGSIWT